MTDVLATEGEAAIGKILDNIPALHDWIFGKTDLTAAEYDSGELLTDAAAHEAATEALEKDPLAVADSLTVSVKPTDTKIHKFWLGRKTGIKAAAAIGGPDVTGYWLKVPLDIAVTMCKVSYKYKKYKNDDAAKKGKAHAEDETKPKPTDDEMEPVAGELTFVHQIEIHKGSGKFYIWCMRSGKLAFSSSTVYVGGKPTYRLQLTLTDLVGWMRKDPDESNDIITIGSDGSVTATVTNRLGPE